MTKHLTEDDFDRALSQENDSISPSSGFAGSVMAAVATQDASSPGMSFPWKQALPGLVATALVIIMFAAAFVFALRTGKPFASVPADLQTIVDVVPRKLVADDAGPVLAVLTVAVASLALTRRLMLSR